MLGAASVGTVIAGTASVDTVSVVYSVSVGAISVDTVRVVNYIFATIKHLTTIYGT